MADDRHGIRFITEVAVFIGSVSEHLQLVEELSELVPMKATTTVNLFKQT
jgi:hypothetical protein